MSFERYLRALAHYWYIPVAFIVAGALGTWVYLQFNLGEKAVVTVAVLEPAITNNLDGEQAQVNFGSIAESRTVAERVVESLDLRTSAEELQSNLSVELSRTLIPSIASPLYTVEYKDPDPAIAIQIVSSVVDESQVVFQELNTIDLAELEEMVEPQEVALRNELTKANENLRSFEQSTRAWLLPVQIEDQVALISMLREPARFGPVTDAVEQELEATLREARAELDTLYMLLPEYERISLDGALAIDRLLIMSDANTLRDFSRSPSTASREIDESLQAWHESRNALLEYVGDEETVTASAQSLAPDTHDAYDRWIAARGALLQTISAEMDRGSTMQPDQTQYENSLGLFDLPARLEYQQDFVESIQYLLLASRIEDLGYEAALAAEELELERLLSLLPEYEFLAARVSQLELALQMGSARKAEMIFQGSLPPAAQIKVLDPAHIESSFLDILFPVALSITFAIATSLFVVYLLAYFIHTPFSADDVKDWMGVPILASLPREKRRTS